MPMALVVKVMRVNFDDMAANLAGLRIPGDVVTLCEFCHRNDSKLVACRYSNGGVRLLFPGIGECMAALKLWPAFPLTCGQNSLQESPVERDHFMTGCLRAPVSMYRSDVMSGAGSLFSPEYKTRATKTTTKTV